MASIQEAKAALMQSAERGDGTLNQIRSATEQTEQVLTRLRAVAAGTGHPKIGKAIQRAEHSKRHLTEAGTLIQGGATAAREYVSVLG
ncbi:hypothetical protein [Plantactinospora sonchi]|uniref:Uncharacterized protein n=1 Tax=Plantactinospora sonchi TaxID=1544735 RepID=A0ABU7RWB9_9ACTN